MRRIPYIDPIDIRYRRFENVPKASRAGGDVLPDGRSGSMSEHMKDLAKRFYMLLYIFLTRRYRHVEIVFIRHTDRAEEVDEQTFFHSPATGGTVVSSAFEAMRRIVEARYPPGGLEHLRRAGFGRRQFLWRRRDDGAAAARRHPAGHANISPISKSATRTSRGDGGSNSSLWGAYENLLRRRRQPLAMRKVNTRGEIFPVFRDLFQRRQGEEKVAS